MKLEMKCPRSRKLRGQEKERDVVRNRRYGFAS